MRKYGPNKHDLNTITMKGYNCAHAGLFCIAKCWQGRINRLSEVANEEVVINDVGKSGQVWYKQLENRFSDIH